MALDELLSLLASEDAREEAARFDVLTEEVQPS